MYPLIILLFTNTLNLMEAKIEKELSMGRISGPFFFKTTWSAHFSIAAIPKKEAGKIRLIHILSFPMYGSVMILSLENSVRCNINCLTTAWTSLLILGHIAWWPKLTSQTLTEFSAWRNSISAFPNLTSKISSILISLTYGPQYFLCWVRKVFVCNPMDFYE